MQTIVIKYGGSVNIAANYLLEEIAYHVLRGTKVVIVHGGGPEISSFLTRLGHSSQFLDGQRVTDETTLEVVEMVLAGRVGKRIVRHLAAHGAKAVSISGEDAGLVKAVPYSDDDLLGLVGKVDEVDTDILHTLLDAGYVPVVAPLGIDRDGQMRNINADFVAGAIAGSLGADAFILATDVPGVKETPTSSSAIAQLTVSEALAMIEDGRATGGMIPKIQAAVEAVVKGAGETWVVDGTRAGIFDGVMRRERIGTRICPTT